MRRVRSRQLFRIAVSFAFLILGLGLVHGFAVSPTSINEDLIPGDSLRIHLISTVDLRLVSHSCIGVDISLENNDIRVGVPIDAAASDQSCELIISQSGREYVTYALPAHLVVRSTLQSNVSVLFDDLTVRVLNLGNASAQVWICENGTSVLVRPSATVQLQTSGQMTISRDPACADVIFTHIFAQRDDPLPKVPSKDGSQKYWIYYLVGGAALVVACLYLALRLRAFLKDTG